MLAGRGFGKTRCGAECVRHWVEHEKVKRLIFAGRTAEDIRDIMVVGESGILEIYPPAKRPLYKPNQKCLVWPNGAKALLLTADRPDIFRGKQCEKAWCDEVASWRYPDAFTQLELGNRLGNSPQIVVTTTPRPTMLIKSLIYKVSAEGKVELDDNGDPVPNPVNAVTRGSTYENKGNLASQFIETIVRKYEGTRIGRQELYAEILGDVEGAIWNLTQIDRLRVDKCPPLNRVVIGVDPNASNNENSDEMGIIAAGTAMVDGVLHGYVLDDKSLRESPLLRGTAVINCYNSNHADLIVPEVNNGGDMVEYLIRSAVTSGLVPRIKPVHATRGKITRAEPIAALYEQGLIHHVGAFPTLEDELCSWVPGGASPNRLDAMVWAFTELFGLREQKVSTGTRTLQVDLRSRLGRR